MERNILIFPGGMPQSLDFQRECLARKIKTVGASSLMFDVAKDQFDSWLYLPFITDPNFKAALQNALREHRVTEIYTPNIVVWNYLYTELPLIDAAVSLTNSSPIENVLGSYRKAKTRADFLVANQLSIASDISTPERLTRLELAALCRYTNLIPGMCDDDKFHALVNIVQHAVNGDIVEIGTWWGKSAFIFAFLAHFHRIGNVLCIDPWANENLIQGEKIVDSGSEQADADEAFEVFQVGLIPLANMRLNFIRKPSVEAAGVYRQSREVCSDAFGTTTYTGKISILHIDGNHSFAAANSDMVSWSDLVSPGGWIIVDDYIWPYGDGPKRVGDDFLGANLTRISAAFVMGGALFMQLDSK